MSDPFVAETAEPERRNIPGESPYEALIGFSRAVRVGTVVYVSGTGPVGADEADVETQTRQVFRIILEAMQRAGGDANDVVRTRMYLVDARDWEIVGRVHGEIFQSSRPAATMVVVAHLLNPSWRVEIEAEALLRETR